MAFEKKVCVKRELYKTELCRHYVLREQCPYKDKCQFAHGSEEIVDIIRHPKYKTELCKGYHSTGFCPYGPRCHFIHGDPEDNSRTSLSTGLMGNTKKQWSISTKSGRHYREIWETANEWQNEDLEMPADWMSKDQEPPNGWANPDQEPVPDCLEGQDQEQSSAWPNHLKESDEDWPNHVQQLPNWMQGQRKSYISVPRNENWINQFRDADHCHYLLMEQNSASQSNFLSSLSQSLDNSNCIVPSQSFPVSAVSSDLRISKPNGPSCFPNQVPKPSLVSMKNKNWNQSYLLQNSIHNTSSDIDAVDWYHQIAASPNAPLDRSPFLDMSNYELTSSSQELISNVSTFLEIFNHNLAADSQSRISNRANISRF